MRKLAFILAAATLVACSTPYQEKGLLGGVGATRLDGTSARIEAQGNGYTPQDTVRDYLLLRAAEETLSAGYGHFEIIDQSGVAYVRGTQPLATNLKVTIRMHPGPKLPASRGFDARETIAILGARYKK